MRQGEQAWLLGGARGNHEYANIRFQRVKDEPQPKYIVKDGASKLGGIELLHVAVTHEGAYLEWTEDFRTFIPRDFFQLTWRQVP
jgi:hypothetical protein